MSDLADADIEDAMYEHLEGVSAAQIHGLMMIPPRHMKLSIRDSRRCRRIPVVPGTLRQPVHITTDQNTKVLFNNDKSRCRLATSVEAADRRERRFHCGNSFNDFPGGPLLISRPVADSRPTSLRRIRTARPSRTTSTSPDAIHRLSPRMLIRS